MTPVVIVPPEALFLVETLAAAVLLPVLAALGLPAPPLLAMVEIEEVLLLRLFAESGSETEEDPLNKPFCGLKAVARLAAFLHFSCRGLSDRLFNDNFPLINFDSNECL